MSMLVELVIEVLGYTADEAIGMRHPAHPVVAACG